MKQLFVFVLMAGLAVFAFSAQTPSDAGAPVNVVEAQEAAAGVLVDQDRSIEVFDPGTVSAFLDQDGEVNQVGRSIEKHDVMLHREAHDLALLGDGHRYRQPVKRPRDAVQTRST